MNWKIGNSTLRNPKRIFNALHIFAKLFDGRIFKPQLLIKQLNESGEFNFKSKNKKIHGNFIRAIFRELGFLNKNLEIETLTPIGRELIKNNSKSQLIYLKQLAKYQFKNGESICKPFLVFAKIITLLFKNGITNITKDEFQLFIITCMDLKDCEVAVSNLLSYREKLNNNVEKKSKLKKEFLFSYFSQIFNTELNEIINNFKKIIVSNSTQVIENNNLLDNIIVSKRGRMSKSATNCKQLIIEQLKNGNIDGSMDIIKNYYFELKTKSLVSDANISLNYIMETGLFITNKLTISIDEKYLPLLKFILNKYHSIYNNNHLYLDNFYFNNENLLTNKVVRVEFTNAIYEIAKKINIRNLSYVLPILLTLGIITQNND